MASGCLTTDDAGRKFLDGGVWLNETVLIEQGGQGMHFHVVNKSASVGTVCTIADQTGYSCSQTILPSLSGDYLFTSFGDEPMGWTFTVTTVSDVFILGWCLYSTWVPGDPPNPNEREKEQAITSRSREKDLVGKINAPTYMPGSFVAVVPNIRTPGTTVVSGDQKALLEIDNAAQIGLGGWDDAAVFTDAGTGESLCQPVGFTVANSQGGATFSTVPPSSGLGIVLSAGPGAGGNPGSEFYVRFAKLSSPQNSSFDVESFFTKDNAAIAIRVMLSPDAKVSLVIDANRYGTTPARARLFNLMNRASPIGQEIAFDGSQLTALVVLKASGHYVARIKTTKETTEIPLP